MSAPELINADFNQRIVVDTDRQPWLASTQPGIERRMRDRIGGEVARATSLVRYAAASSFPEHVYGTGEEFLVLDGIFSDEHGDYPTGTYVRNPPGSRHAPRTAKGCTIFVKLRQMQTDEQQRRVVDTTQEAWVDGSGPGHQIMPLYADPFEHVTLERLANGASTRAEAMAGGQELLVLTGALADRHGIYRAGTWLRTPTHAVEDVTATGAATFWVKRGHLPPDPQPRRP
jgi:anti-sigma factor ChrR (cupin superfamily)